ncbi:TPM domain-containing protein [Sphingomonas immobilis]|uniref:TPM domain-containing protein n=1 Tax=Sphingomonas immobilis TaxID=3063997 RepID=A0ABT9A4E1_9SPHN|nr:TPM domain-containing protein [Sphingomonas sp. CA1-15]MDO7844711.1 TPM domain-containing protein [Sphingomonas sp. CA1-15]
MKILRALLLVLFLAFAGAAQAQQSLTFPNLTGRVVDEAKLLSPEQVQDLTAKSEAIEKASSRQLVIATIPDLQDTPIEDYGYKLGRYWKLGQAGANNGIILIVAPKERKVRIEVGRGLEPIMTDALSSVIIRDTILPRFKAGDMAGGIIAGADAIGEQMKLPLEAGEQRAAAAVQASEKRERRSGGGINGGFIVLAIMIGLFFVLPMLFRRAGGRRYQSSGWGDVASNVVLWSALDSLTRNNNSGSGWGSGGSDWGSSDSGGGSDFSGGGGDFGGGGASGDW